MTALGPGTVVAGDFRILRPLNTGGMGAVYVALQISTNRERALKVMLGELATNEELKSRFVQEATIGAHIASDHAVEVVAAGIDPSTGAPWLAMELLEGEDLAHFLAKSGPMSPAWVLDLFEQMTHALGAAHERGIVHRDLKPENVFLAKSRRANQSFMVKVLDFGIAKLLGAAKSSATAAVGTPLWMAPEQTQASHAIAPTADVWAMGLIAFRALTGRVYWRTATDPEASSMMILREVVFEPIVPASERARALGGAPLPPGFDAWFARCVNREPAARFPDARAMQAELRAVLAAATTGAPVEAWQATQIPSGSQPALPSAPAVNLPPPGYPPTPPAQAPSFVTVPPVVQSFTGGSSGMVGPPPPPPAARRKKTPFGLYAGLGVGAAALLLVAIVIATTSSSSKKAGASSSASAAAPAKSTPPPAPETPFAAQQGWDGFYVCGQGKSNLTLRIEGVAGRTVNAVFEFFVPTQGVRGSFRMNGPYDPATRKLKLKAGAWIVRPPNYETVSLEGAVSPDGHTYAGRILNPRCSSFTTTLAPAPGAPQPAPVPDESMP